MMGDQSSGTLTIVGGNCEDFHYRVQVLSILKIHRSGFFDELRNQRRLADTRALHNPTPLARKCPQRAHGTEYAHQSIH